MTYLNIIANFASQKSLRHRYHDSKIHILTKWHFYKLNRFIYNHIVALISYGLIVKIRIRTFISFRVIEEFCKKTGA